MPPRSRVEPQRLPGLRLRSLTFWSLSRPGWTLTDTGLLLALVLGFVYAVLQSKLRIATPIEDAAMLFRYSHHLAQGHGIRWNIDEAPVDGATDFLFMVVCGMGERLLHISAFRFSLLLNGAAHLLSVLLVFAGGRCVLGANRWVCVAAAAILLKEPGLGYTGSGFGAPSLAGVLVLTWCLLFWYERTRLRGSAAVGVAVLAALCGLIGGLTRPEGVLVAFLMLGWTVYRIGWDESRPLVVAFVAVFLVGGLPYFAWRWHYFGYPLPNPFYVKGDGHLYPDSVKHSFVYLIEMLTPVLPFLVLGWCARETRRVTTSIVGLLFTFGSMWILLNNAMNQGRFQYEIVPAVLFTVPAVSMWLELPAVRFWQGLEFLPRVAVALSAALFVAVSGTYLSRTYRYTPITRGMVALGQRLARYDDRHYTMAVTEAGVLPYTSDWKTVDVLGLNNSYLAHHGGLMRSPDFLDPYSPEVIMSHVFYTEPFAQTQRMITGSSVVKSDSVAPGEAMAMYAREHGYTLAAAFGSDTCGMQLFWVKNSSPDFAGLVHDIRDYPMVYMDSGLIAHDYRDDKPMIPDTCGLAADSF